MSFSRVWRSDSSQTRTESGETNGTLQSSPPLPGPPSDLRARGGRSSAQRLYRFVLGERRNRVGELVYLVSQTSAVGVNVVTNLVAAKFLAPAELGTVQTALLITTYCSFMHLGVFNGLNRDVAFHDGAGNSARSQELINASWGTALANSLVGIAVATAAWAYLAATRASALELQTVAILYASLICVPLTTHYETTYKSSRAFLPLGVALNIGNGINLLLGVIPAFLGALGLVLRNTLLPVANLALLVRGNPRAATAVGRVRDAVALGRTGLPILASGMVLVLLTVADRTVAAVTLGPLAVGQLALASMIAAAIQVVPQSVGTMLYPRIAYEYGLAGTSRSLRRFYFVALAVNAATVLPISLACYFAVGPLTERFLPAYAGGIRAAQIYCLSSVFLLHTGVGTIMPVLRRNAAVITANGLALALFWLMVWGLFLTRPPSIVGIAFARLTAQAFLCVFTLAYAYYLTSTDIRA